ncbi:hypothetical protein PR048_030118 [Dryococelus australis]|uniref:Uncharacterized protein n=1 Tax=Dryococelus australis TaxID=614101 RepID=A0ABQ9G817_9NEOP|nr:hypothetical protein PR048_030118 [Dryococelus australis]
MNNRMVHQQLVSYRHPTELLLQKERNETWEFRRRRGVAWETSGGRDRQRLCGNQHFRSPVSEDRSSLAAKVVIDYSIKRRAREENRSVTTVRYSRPRDGWEGSNIGIRLNFTVLYILESASFLDWLLHGREATPPLTELHVIGAHNCEVFIYWRRVTHDVSDTLFSNEKRIAKIHVFDSKSAKKPSVAYRKMAARASDVPGGENGRFPRKHAPPIASSGTITTCENSVTRPGIEAGSPWWEASVLIAQPQWPPYLRSCVQLSLPTRSRALALLSHGTAQSDVTSERECASVNILKILKHVLRKFLQHYRIIQCDTRLIPLPNSSNQRIGYDEIKEAAESPSPPPANSTDSFQTTPTYLAPNSSGYSSFRRKPTIPRPTEIMLLAAFTAVFHASFTVWAILKSVLAQSLVLSGDRALDPRVNVDLVAHSILGFKRGQKFLHVSSNDSTLLAPGQHPTPQDTSVAVKGGSSWWRKRRRRGWVGHHAIEHRRDGIGQRLKTGGLGGQVKVRKFLQRWCSMAMREGLEGGGEEDVPESEHDCRSRAGLISPQRIYPSPFLPSQPLHKPTHVQRALRPRNLPGRHSYKLDFRLTLLLFSSLALLRDQVRQKCVKAVHDKVSTIEKNLRKKSLTLHAYILMGALSDIRPLKMVTIDGNRPPVAQSVGAPPIWGVGGSGFESQCVIKPMLEELLGVTAEPPSGTFDKPESTASEHLRESSRRLPSTVSQWKLHWRMAGYLSRVTHYAMCVHVHYRCRFVTATTIHSVSCVLPVPEGTRLPSIGHALKLHSAPTRPSLNSVYELVATTHRGSSFVNIFILCSCATSGWEFHFNDDLQAHVMPDKISSVDINARYEVRVAGVASVFVMGTLIEMTQNPALVARAQHAECSGLLTSSSQRNSGCAEPSRCSGQPYKNYGSPQDRDRRRAAGEVNRGKEVCDCEYQAVKGAAGRLYYWTRCDDAAGWRVFSGISRFPRPCIPALLHIHLAPTSSALKTSLFKITACDAVRSLGYGKSRLTLLCQNKGRDVPRPNFCPRHDVIQLGGSLGRAGSPVPGGVGPPAPLGGTNLFSAHQQFRPSPAGANCGAGSGTGRNRRAETNSSFARGFREKRANRKRQEEGTGGGQKEAKRLGGYISACRRPNDYRDWPLRGSTALNLNAYVPEDICLLGNRKEWLNSATSLTRAMLASHWLKVAPFEEFQTQHPLSTSLPSLLIKHEYQPLSPGLALRRNKRPPYPPGFHLTLSNMVVRKKNSQPPPPSSYTDCKTKRRGASGVRRCPRRLLSIAERAESTDD